MPCLRQHIIAAGPKPADEYRVLVIGDSSTWGILLRPEQTLAGQLEKAGLTLCGKTVRVYNLGYPTISLTKDLMVLDYAMRYQPDLIIWPMTLQLDLRARRDVCLVRKSLAIAQWEFDTAHPDLRLPRRYPVFDCTSASSGTDFLSISGTNWYICGLTITNSGHNSIRIIGNNITIERCVSYGARNTGIHISGGNGVAIYPANNLILNCDSIRSYDAPVGGNADGFSAKWSLGTNNVFHGCRAWENSDDNWDLWMGTQPVLIENCWAFHAATNIWNSGSFDGNGNGFKLGGDGTPAAHRVVGSLSFGNKVWGIDQNNNAAGQMIDQTTVWGNGGGAINLNHLDSQYGTLQSSHVLRNNVAIGTITIGSTSAYPSVQISNTWQVVTDVNTNDFLNTDWTWAMAPRRDDGGLPETPFLRPVPGGRLQDKGADLGEPFAGPAPDLGAFESLVW